MKPPKSRKANPAPNAVEARKSRAEAAESAEFKMTELGPIPVDWEVCEIGDIACVCTGNSNTQDKVATGMYPFYVRSPIVERINEYEFDTEGVITVGDGVGTGKVFHYVNGKFALHQRCYLIDRFCSNVDVKYFFKIFSALFYDRVMQMTAKSSVDSVRREMITGMPIPLPPLAEQRRIAGALSDIDELISALGKLIEKKRNIKTGAMQELLGMRNGECGMRNVPRRRLPGFSGEWVEKRLGECGSFSKGAGISRAQANSGRIPAVRYGELYTTHHEYIKAFESFISDDVARCSTRLTRGDIVFACSGETKEEIGKCAAFLGDEIAYAGGDLLILSPKEAYDSKFLAFELNTPFCASQKAAAGQGDAVVHIRQHSLEELIVCIPPTLAEQKAIAAVLSDMDAEIAALEADRTKYESIKQGMMQELLTGKTRLKGE